MKQTHKIKIAKSNGENFQWIWINDSKLTGENIRFLMQLLRLSLPMLTEFDGVLNIEITDK